MRLYKTDDEQGGEEMRHDDENELADYVMDRASHHARWTISSIIEGCLFRVLIFFILLGLVGAVIYKVVTGDGLEKMQEASRAIDESIPGKELEAQVITWDGKEPFACGGSKVLEIRGATAAFDKGAAISAKGNCELTLVDVTLTAETGILVGGNATVHVRGESTITGKKHSANVGGNGTLIATGATFVGEKKLSPSATFKEQVVGDIAPGE